MFTDHERFRNLAAAFQSMFFCLAVIIGGVWTYYTFTALRQTENTNLELERRNTELKKNLRDLQKKRIINIRILPTQRSIPGDDSKYILALIEITNVGNYPENLIWQGPPLSVKRISLDHRDELESEEISSVFVLPSSTGGTVGAVVNPGEVWHIPCLVKVIKPGLYYLSFGVRASTDEQEVPQDERITSALEWGNSVSVVVE
jgi:hypothetical protein